MMQFLLAASPVLILIAALFVFRLNLFKAAALSFLVSVVVAASAWSVGPLQVLSAVAKASLLSGDIVLIIFGAVFFLAYLRRSGVIESLESLLKALSPDRRIQALLLAWLFGSFIEGTSGFGTPAAVVAPLLVGIGFPATTAILVCLVANSTAVPFGAVGTPVRIGLSGLDFASVDIASVAQSAAWINLFAGLCVPLMILALIVRASDRRSWRAFFECVPFALFTGSAFLLPYYFFSHFGYELPSILGAPIGLILAVVALRWRFLLPKQILLFPGPSVERPRRECMGIVQTLGPYFLLVGLLLAGKLLFVNLQFRLELGSDLAHSIQLFNPGFAFLTVIALLVLLRREPVSVISSLATQALRPLARTAVSIFFIAAMTYVMVLTGQAGREEGMLETLAQPLLTSVLPFFSVFIGAFGAFLAGSATVSNLLFAPIQAQAAIELGIGTSWILALQLVGAGVGNMVALQNILAVQAAVGLKGDETRLLRALVFPCLLYLMIASLLGAWSAFG